MKQEEDLSFYEIEFVAEEAVVDFSGVLWGDESEEFGEVAQA